VWRHGVWRARRPRCPTAYGRPSSSPASTTQPVPWRRLEGVTARAGASSASPVRPSKCSPANREPRPSAPESKLFDPSDERAERARQLVEQFAPVGRRESLESEGAARDLRPRVYRQGRERPGTLGSRCRARIAARSSGCHGRDDRSEGRSSGRPVPSLMSALAMIRGCESITPCERWSRPQLDRSFGKIRVRVNAPTHGRGEGARS
jgi:hypothetical protein